MSWDEHIFQAIFRRTVVSKKNQSNTVVRLVDCQRRLQVLASALTQRPITVRSSVDGETGIQENVLYVPDTIDHFDNAAQNLRVLLFQALLHSFDYGLRLVGRGVVFPEETCELLFERYPGSLEIFNSIKTFPSPYGLRTKKNSGVKATLALNPGSNVPGKPSTELRVRSVLNPTRIELEKKEENPVIHVLEKVQTAEEYSGGSRQSDGTDSLKEHEEALNELELRHVIRSQERTSAMIQSDAVFESSGLSTACDEEMEIEARKFTYPEWSYADSRYRKNWCTLYEVPPQIQSKNAPLPDQYLIPSSQAKALKQRLSALVNKRLWKKRLPDGTDIDIDEAIQAQIDIHAKVQPSNTHYVDRLRLQSDVATLILLDLSMSTDSWVANRRILDVLKEGVATLSHALADSPDQFEIAGFHSLTRNQCRYTRIKPFGVAWRDGALALLRSDPQGHTRIGPALRHACHSLSSTYARKKLLILLSDSRPTDFDQYEGTYGVEDVRKATQEARAQSIIVRALCVSDRPDKNMDRMYGRGCFSRIMTPASLADEIFDIYYEMIR